MSQKSTPPVIRFWSPLRIVSSIIVLGLLAAFGVSSCNSNDNITSTNTSAPAGGPNNPVLPQVPSPVLQTEMRTTSGERIKLANYSGKVMLVNLWATWCGPCQMETPELVKLHKEFQGRGVEMIGLSTEDPDASAESVRRFVQAFNVDYQVGWATPEVAAILMQGRGSIPQSFVISRDGRLVKRFIGLSPAIVPKIRAALEEALNLAS